MTRNNLLTDRNFELFAAKNYRNPQCLDPDEFYEDLAKIKYVQRLLRKYRDAGELRERLILNHLIAFYNVFEISAATQMMYYRIDENMWPVLKTFLIFLNYLPEQEIRSGCGVDIKVAAKLKNL